MNHATRLIVSANLVLLGNQLADDAMPPWRIAVTVTLSVIGYVKLWVSLKEDE